MSPTASSTRASGSRADMSAVLPAANTAQAAPPGPFREFWIAFCANRGAVIGVAIVLLPHYVRLTRGAVITEVSKDYVTAAKVGGAGTVRLMFSEVLPNCAAPLIVQASLGVSTGILDAAALGFLGLGAQPPSPEWGTMLADAREFVLRAWWVVTFPGLMILMAVLAFNLLGDGLRDALDSKLKR